MSKPKTCCPHCGKKDCFAEVAVLNAKTYGGGGYKMLCEFCQKPIVVYLSRVVVCEGVGQGHHSKDECDWT